jgi:nucleoside phosphorylase
MITRLAWHSTGQTIATGHIDGTISIHDLSTNTNTPLTSASNSMVDALEFSSDGVLLAARHMGGNHSVSTVRVWSTQDWNVVGEKSETSILSRGCYGFELFRPATHQLITPGKHDYGLTLWEVDMTVLSQIVKQWDTTSSPQSIDIAILTVIQEEYSAVHTRLDNPKLYQGEVPNIFAWETSEVLADSGKTYRVVLAMSGEHGQVPSSQMAFETISHWRPQYVVLVGIAGGLQLDNLQLGDVALSSTIYGYEYGKIKNSGFEPRHNWVHRPDQGLLTSALRFQAVNPNWSDSLPVSPKGSIRSKAVAGNIASGDKLVDGNPQFFSEVQQAWEKLLAVEMEGVGAADAVEFAVAKKIPTGFFMVRGISDQPPLNATSISPATQSSERDAWKQYAAESAAEFVICWIRNHWHIAPRVT